MDYQYQPIPVKNASYYRRRARGALKGFFGYALLAFLIAALLGGASGGLTFNFNFEDVYNPDGIESSVALENFSYQLEHFAEVLETGDFSYIVSVYPILSALTIGLLAVIVFLLLFSVFVSSPVAIGYLKYNLDLIDGKRQTELGTLFSFFKRSYGKTILVHILYGLIGFACTIPLAAIAVLLAWFSKGAFLELMRGDLAQIFTLMLAALILLVASILTAVLKVVVQYRYHYASMILAEYPEIGVFDAFRSSASMMRGNKWKLFCLQISFIGWILLVLLCACCTCGIGGIGMILLMPYMNAANAAFYDEIANRAAAREAEFPSLDPDDYMA